MNDSPACSPKSDLLHTHLALAGMHFCKKLLLLCSPGERRGVPATEGVPGIPAMEEWPAGVWPEAQPWGVALTEVEPALGSRLSPKSPFSMCTPLVPPMRGVCPCCRRARFWASVRSLSSPPPAVLGVRMGVANLQPVSFMVPAYFLALLG